MIGMFGFFVIASIALSLTSSTVSRFMHESIEGATDVYSEGRLVGSGLSVDCLRLSDAYGPACITSPGRRGLVGEAPRPKAHSHQELWVASRRGGKREWRSARIVGKKRCVIDVTNPAANTARKRRNADASCAKSVTQNMW